MRSMMVCDAVGIQENINCIFFLLLLLLFFISCLVPSLLSSYFSFDAVEVQ